MCRVEAPVSWLPRLGTGIFGFPHWGTGSSPTFQPQLCLWSYRKPVITGFSVCFAFFWRKRWFWKKVISFRMPWWGKLPTSSRLIPPISCAMLPTVNLWKGLWDGGSFPPTGMQCCSEGMRLSEVTIWKETWKNTGSRSFLNSFLVQVSM